MVESDSRYCPECEDVAGPVDRRSVLRVVGGQAAALVAVGSAAAKAPAPNTKVKTIEKPAKPAEALIRDLYATLSDDQKKDVVLPWDHRRDGGKGPLT